MSETTETAATQGVDALWDDLTAPEPETVADAVTDTTPVETAAEETTEGPARNPDGTFAAKASDDAAEETTAEDAETTEEEPAAEETTDAPAVWSFKLDGEDVDVPGSRLDADGNLVIAGAENIDLVSKFLGKGQKLDGYRERVAEREQRLRAEFLQREAAYQVEQAQFQPMKTRLDALLSALEGAGDTDKAVAAANAWVADLVAALPTLSGEMQLAKARAEFEATQRMQAPPPEQQAAQLQQERVTTLAEEFAALRQQPWAAALSAADWREIGDTVMIAGDAFFVPAPYDVPESGIVKGDTVLDRSKVVRIAHQRAQQRREASTARQSKAAVTASKTTQQRTAKVGTPAPAPSTTVPRSGQGSGTKPPASERRTTTSATPKRITTLQEWIDW